MVGLSPTSATSFSNVTIIDGSPTGGKCASGCKIFHTTTEEFGNAWTIATWVNNASWSPNNDIISCKNTSASTYCQWYFSVINAKTFNLGINGGSSTVSLSYNFSANTWYHVAATYDGEKYAMYINGECVKSGAYSSAMKTGCTNVCAVCRSTNAQGTSPTAGGSKTSDFRIYDHALEAWEIKDLYNCKVFGVNGGLYLEETTNIVSSIPSAGENNVAYDVATWATTVTSVTNKNGIYTFSAYITNTSDHPLNCRLSCYNSAGTSYNALQGNSIPSGSEGRSVVTCNTTNTSEFNGTIYLYIQNGNGGVNPTNKRFYLREVQFEEKDHATPLSFGHRDSRIADLTDFNQNNITPYSLVKSGSTLYFDGVNSAIQIPGHELISAGTWTVNLWFLKPNGMWSSKGYETLFGGPSGFELEAKSAATNVNKIVLWNWGKGNCDYEFDKWNMVTMTRTSSGVKLYLNGELKATGSAGSMPTGNYFIGAWNTATQQNFKGYIRSASIYKKELSQEDITNLYTHGQ